MDDDWETADWDEKVKDIEIKQKADKLPSAQLTSGSFSGFHDEEQDGSYFEKNESRRKLEQMKLNEPKHHGGGYDKKEDFKQPLPTKRLTNIQELIDSPNSFHKFLYETFGEFERFLATHDDPDLSDEKLVLLLNIDVALLEVPFKAHNEFLLRKISKVEMFWDKLIMFMRAFLEYKKNDMKLHFQLDMNGFFNNIEFLLQNLLMNNFFNTELEVVFKKLIEVMESFDGNQWSNEKKLKSLLENYQKNSIIHKNYDIYPTLLDLSLKGGEDLKQNQTHGEYENVSNYLQVHLPLLKEDFICKLRFGVKKFASSENVKAALRTSDVWLHPKVQITAVKKKFNNMICRYVVVKIKARETINYNKRFFAGQMLCFSTSLSFANLVVAVVIKRDQQGQAANEINIEVIKTENLADIFDRDLFMLEPMNYFEPYHQVFNVVRNFNEHNFPFKNRILSLDKKSKLPSYIQSDQNDFNFSGFTFNVANLESWPTHEQLGVEEMQLKAIKSAITSDFSLIQGPPGTGKTFVGLKILQILLENTDERVLILTQTNNALDKFLLGASKFTKSIVRLGGQSKCEDLKQFMPEAKTPEETIKYRKKLQYLISGEVSMLMRKDENSNEIHKRISENHRLMEEIYQLISYQAIMNKRIIGMTTTFAAKNTGINKMLKPGVVIIEEASEVLESHVLAALTKHTKQVIMIGDHQQLKPQVTSSELATVYDFNLSLFERLIFNDFDFTTLDVQMRMRPEICDLVRGTIYPHLKDGKCVQDYPMVKGLARNVYWVDHTIPESVGEGETSKENSFEVDYVLKLASHLIKNGNSPNDITILTAYAAQAAKIKSSLKKPNSTVKVAVLDSYQGEESEIILLSLVRSNDRHDVGFLKQENRIAVLLSRAKSGFYIIGNANCFDANAASPEKMKIKKPKVLRSWSQVVKILKDKDAIGNEIPGME